MKYFTCCFSFHITLLGNAFKIITLISRKQVCSIVCVSILDSAENTTFKCPRKVVKPPENRGIGVTGAAAWPQYASFEKELCDALHFRQNAAVFMPHSRSHLVIAAETINSHFNQMDADSNAVIQPTLSSDQTAERENQDVPDTTEIKPDIRVHNSMHNETMDKPIVCSKNVQESLPAVSGSFYKQQRKKRAKQRQRHITISGETIQAEPKLDYKKKQRRRTKSSSDSLSYLEDDISTVSKEVANVQVDEDTSHETLEKRAVLVIVPSSKAIAASAAKLRTALGQLTIAEHGVISKLKVGIRRLLKSTQVVISHLPAVRNSIKAKSLSVKDVSLIVFMDIFYSDDIFTLMPNRMENGPTTVMIFKEFPYDLTSVLWKVFSVMLSPN